MNRWPWANTDLYVQYHYAHIRRAPGGAIAAATGSSDRAGVVRHQSIACLLRPAFFHRTTTSPELWCCAAENAARCTQDVVASSPQLAQKRCSYDVSTSGSAGSHHLGPEQYCR